MPKKEGDKCQHEVTIGNHADLLTTQDLMSILSVSRQTLTVWRMNKVGPRWVKIGSKAIRYPRDAFLDWLNTTVVTPKNIVTKEKSL